MGNKSTFSWFTTVKRAFTPHKSTKTQHEDHHDKILHKKRRLWLFTKSSSTSLKQQTQLKVKPTSNDTPQLPNLTAEEENHVILTPEATETTVHAATKIFGSSARTSSISMKHHFAAIIIQTSFRGYLARRALQALRGIVMLQAVIRGQNVRKQAAITLRCMQALLRVQSHMHDQRSRLSHDETKQRNSMLTASDRPHNLEELDAIMQNRKISNRSLSTMDENELEETSSWLDRWLRAKQWENKRTCRASFDRRDSIKTIEIDHSRPSSRSGNAVHRRSYQGSHYIPNLPNRRSSNSPSTGQQPITPSPSKTVPIQIRSTSPRCLKEEKSYLNANIQRLRLSPRVMGSMCRYSTCVNDMSVPNYMAATESAKAKIRSQSTPRQRRPSTPERERVGSVKKRLAYPVQDAYDSGCDNDNGHNLRSPSIKSVQVGHVGMGQQPYYTDCTTGGEISPCSTTDLRRWLR